MRIDSRAYTRARAHSHTLKHSNTLTLIRACMHARNETQALRYEKRDEDRFSHPRAHPYAA